MSDPITTAIATAAAGSAAQSLTTQAGVFLTQIIRKLQKKFKGRPDELAALGPAQNERGVHDHAAMLAASLQRAFEEDPAFAREVLKLWRNYLKATTSTVTNNTFNGVAEKLVQLQDVHGNLTIN